jgi:NADPH:quinone reductase-like Zn-dependent oxidoreductase
MRAVVHDRYGPPEVQRLKDVERPVPKDDEVLVRVHATTVNRTDCGFRAAKPFITRFFTGIRRPKRRILGMEFAGEVEDVGAAVTEFEAGDAVFGVKGAGAHAELICVREPAPMAHKPASMSFEQAAAVSDGACTALGCLRQAELERGQRIVILGASGSIGTAAVQLAKHHFDAHVTAVCNTKNVELVRSLGADEVIDYTRDDFTQNGETYKVILDAVGKYSYTRSRHSLEPEGYYIATDGFQNLGWSLWTWKIGKKQLKVAVARYRKEDVLLLKELIEAGKYRAVIDRTYPLEQIVDATRYVETHQKTGNVVLSLSENP